MALPEIPIAQFTTPLVGARLPATDLPSLVKSEKMIIIHFLRQLGCIYCKHSVDKLHKIKQQSVKFPTIYFVHQSSVEMGEDFFAERFPGTPHISDPELKLYTLFGIARMSPLQLLNPVVIQKGAESLLAGNVQTAPQGDVWILSGTFLYNNGNLVWAHRAQFAGDDPKWEKFLG